MNNTELTLVTERVWESYHKMQLRKFWLSGGGGESVHSGPPWSLPNIWQGGNHKGSLSSTDTGRPAYLTWSFAARASSAKSGSGDEAYWEREDTDKQSEEHGEQDLCEDGTEGTKSSLGEENSGGKANGDGFGWGNNFAWEDGNPGGRAARGEPGNRGGNIVWGDGGKAARGEPVNWGGSAAWGDGNWGGEVARGEPGNGCCNTAWGEGNGGGKAARGEPGNWGGNAALGDGNWGGEDARGEPGNWCCNAAWWEGNWGGKAGRGEPGNWGGNIVWRDRKGGDGTAGEDGSWGDICWWRGNTACGEDNPVGTIPWSEAHRSRGMGRLDEVPNILLRVNENLASSPAFCGLTEEFLQTAQSADSLL